MIAPEILELCCCPETGQRMNLADASVVEALNQKIAARQLVNRSGKPVTLKIDGALVREDGKQLYVIRDDVPDMLVDEAIPLLRA
jgi:uncharacterized protein YbaR (Trm112 family)